MTYSQHGLELVGFSSGSSFIGGFVRVTFPFFAGVFIYRYRLFKLAFPVRALAVAIALIAVLAAPIFQGAWGYDAIAVTGLFPAIVILGANAPHSGFLSKAWTALGKLSYPFYIIHQPILRVMVHAQKLPHLPSTVAAALPALGLLAAMAGAYVVMTFYDQPVRRWLTARRGAMGGAPPKRSGGPLAACFPQAAQRECQITPPQ